MKPMLAPNQEFDIEKVQWPKYASAKLDGIRAIQYGSALRSRTLKTFPNIHTMSLFTDPLYSGLDGELIVGEANAFNSMQATFSGVMSIAGTPEVTFHVFDQVKAGQSFTQRKTGYERLLAQHPHPQIKIVPQTLLHSAEDLEAFEEICLLDGYEGVMLRGPKGLYKHGRATVRENTLLKVKRFITSEAIVLAPKELMTNTNPLEYDERGYAKRSKHQDNLVPAGTLGGFTVRDCETSIVFDCGTGVLTDPECAALWDNAQALVGRKLTYKHFPHGVKIKPRMPTFVAWRSDIDR